ncbi:MAG: hypothetical protein ACRD1K_03365 [Acidimicrobiales bacterium]
MNDPTAIVVSIDDAPPVGQAQPAAFDGEAVRMLDLPVGAEWQAGPEIVPRERRSGGDAVESVPAEHRRPAEEEHEKGKAEYRRGAERYDVPPRTRSE